MIAPFKDATRAEIASMLQNIRVNAGIDKNPVTANNDCPICPVDKKAFVQEEVLSVFHLLIEDHYGTKCLMKLKKKN